MTAHTPGVESFDDANPNKQHGTLPIATQKLGRAKCCCELSGRIRQTVLLESDRHRAPTPAHGVSISVLGLSQIGPRLATRADLFRGATIGKASLGSRMDIGSPGKLCLSPYYSLVCLTNTRSSPRTYCP